MMITQPDTDTAAAYRAEKGALGRRQSRLGLDYLLATFAGVFIAGLYADGWAHDQGFVDSFFTPWHAILYSGFALTGVTLGVLFLWSMLRGASWRQALPAGQYVTLLGAALFLLGGGFDLLWHTLFGIEVSVEALLSPSHLLLALAGSLVVTGPLRAALARLATSVTAAPTGASVPARGASWLELLPALLSLLYLLSVFTFFTLYAQPFHNPWASRALTGEFAMLGQALAIAGVLVYTAMFVGILLYALRRWTLPFGAVTVILTLNVTLVTVMHGEQRLIPAALAAGIVADVVLLWARGTRQVLAQRTFAVAVPVSLYLVYFLILRLTTGLTWSVSLWLGAVVLGGVAGYLLSYLQAAPLRALSARA